MVKDHEWLNIVEICERLVIEPPKDDIVEKVGPQKHPHDQTLTTRFLRLQYVIKTQKIAQGFQG